MASHFSVSSEVWLACFMTAELLLFFNFEYCLLKIGQTWRLWCCLAQTVLKQHSRDITLLVPFADFQTWGWVVSRTVWGTCPHPPLDFWVWFGSLFWRGEGGPLYVQGMKARKCMKEPLTKNPSFLGFLWHLWLLCDPNHFVFAAGDSLDCVRVVVPFPTLSVP